MDALQDKVPEAFTLAGKPQDFTLGDFWQWRSTDLLNNLTRGYLAEFIVAHTLGIHERGPLPKWESHDLLFQGKRLEIKASGYIQEWSQRINTNPRFSIRPAKSWNDDTGYSEKARRNSDIYIFCVLAETDRIAACLPRLDKWEFYPVLTTKLDAMLGDQKSIGMSTLCRICPEPFDYASLHDAVVSLFEKAK